MSHHNDPGRQPSSEGTPLTSGAWPSVRTTAVDVLNSLGAVWSPDFDAYASGELDVSQVRCALCRTAPCQCPPFGTDEYFALVDEVHGRSSTSGAAALDRAHEQSRRRAYGH